MSDEKPSIILYQFPAYRELESVSWPCLKIHRLLQFKGLAYTTEDRSLTRFGRRRAVHPSGKLPALRYGDELVADSAAIARFIEARHPEPRLVPSEPSRRALCDLLEDWADESLYWYTVYYAVLEYSDDLRPTYFPALPRLLDPVAGWLHRGVMRLALFGQGTGRYSRRMVDAQFQILLDALETPLEEGFLLGDSVTIADLAIYAALRRLTTGATPSAGRMIAARPALSTWLERVEATATKGGARGLRARP